MRLIDRPIATVFVVDIDALSVSASKCVKTAFSRGDEQRVTSWRIQCRNIVLRWVFHVTCVECYCLFRDTVFPYAIPSSPYNGSWSWRHAAILGKSSVNLIISTLHRWWSYLTLASGVTSNFGPPGKETNWALLFLVPTTRPTTATYHHNTNTSAAKRQPGLFTTKLVYMYTV